MASRLSPAGKKALVRFAVLLLCTAAVQALAFVCFQLEGEAAPALYLLCFYALMPAAAAAVPFWAALGGVHPLAACLPVGGLPLVLSSAPSPALCLACIALSLVSAAAAQEWKKRSEKKEEKPGHVYPSGRKKRK